MERNEPGSVAVLLASVPAAKDAELWAFTLEPGDRYDAEPDPSGWSEMLFVSEGSIRVRKQDGDISLRAGDHVVIPTARHYAYINDDDTRARFVRVVVR